MFVRSASLGLCASATLWCCSLSCSLMTPSCSAQELGTPSALIRKISGPNERLELTTNSSRILTLEKPIPRVQVNNPDLLAVTPLSANEVQVSAKKAGVTAVNLWDEDGQVHTVDVFIYGDVRELENAYKTQFPNSAIRVYRYSSSLVLTGFIDRPDYVTPIVQMAEDYSPKVINNISVGGVQQVLLKVKVYEISRTKLTKAGFDWAALGGGGSFLSTRPTGLLANTTNATGGAIQAVADTGGQIVEFGVVGSDSFFGWMDFLSQNNLAKVLAEPNIMAVSGRPAQFNEGGEIPVLVPQGLGQVSIEYKKFGTQVDFLPIVLGNGNIRLEVRPRISDIDDSRAITINNSVIPGLTVREVDTAAELQAGQTFALAGLIQRRTESVNRGLPYLSDLPILGAPFRRTEEEINEIELLILVTPEFVDAMDPHEVPKCAPGMGTMSPTRNELIWGGHIEVPNQCNPCAACGCVPTHGHEPCCPGGSLDNAYGCQQCRNGGAPVGGAMGQPSPMVQPTPMEQPMPMQMGPSLEPGMPMLEGSPVGPGPMAPPQSPEVAPTPAQPGHGDLKLPPPAEDLPTPLGARGPGSVAPRYAAPRAPQYVRQASRPYNPQTPPQGPAPDGGGFIGPVGYDAGE